MKYLITICFINILSYLGWCAELVPFKVTPQQEIGKSRAFELSKGCRSVIKVPRGGFLVLELIDTGRDGNDKTSTEFCSLAWTYIFADGATSGKEKCFIRYARKEIKKGEVQVTQIGGSKHISIRGVNLEWSYSTEDMVFIYPDSGIEYSLIKEVEHVVDGKPPEAPQPPR